MNKFLKIFLYSLAGFIGVFLLLGLLLPKEIEVKRSLVILAPKNLIKENIIDFRKMRDWSPWAEIDTTMEYSFEGETGEVGSVYYWNGNDEVGEGNMRLVSVEDDEIEMKLTFIRPFEAENKVWYELEEVKNGTDLTWGFKGENPFPINVFALFMDFEGMIGKDYDKGLSKLKAITETQAEQERVADSEIPEVQELDLPEKLYVAKKDIVDETEARSFIDETTEAAEKKLIESKLDSSLPKVSVVYSTEDGEMEIAAGKSVTEEVDIEDFELIKVKEGKVLKMIHTGSYETIEGAYITLMNYQNMKGYETTGIVVEEYLVDSATEKDSTRWKTAVYMYVQ